MVMSAFNALFSLRTMSELYADVTIVETSHMQLNGCALQNERTSPMIDETTAFEIAKVH